MKITKSLFAFALAALGASSAQAQGTSARQALDLVSAQFGPQAVQWVAEMRAHKGIPQPTDWQILAYDDRAPRLLYNFVAGNGRAGDAGLDETRYPGDVPVGYFSPNQIAVDSVAAFTVVEGEARKARVSFDSCDYMLRCRDFSTEPVWRLELFDASNAIVGKIYLSANTAQVLRTVWIYRDQRARSDGRPLIIDSFAPTQQNVPTSVTGVDPNMQNPIFNDPGRLDTGIVRMPPRGNLERLQTEGLETGIAGMPPRTGPRMVEPQGPAPYVPTVPAAPGPVPAPPTGPVVDDGIPDPPAIANNAPPATSGGSEMRDLRDPPAASNSSTPPITAPDNSGGASGRIPPPPIPR